MTMDERDALLDLLHVIMRVTFRYCKEGEKVELLAQWRESYDILCNKTCSSDKPN
jgi:hypothetical protein